MYEEQQKQSKLVSVINDLTSIKQQLHLLMAPKSEERTTDSLLKSQNPQGKQIRQKVDAQKSDRFIFKHLHENIGNPSPIRQHEKYVLTFQPKHNPSPIKNEKQLLTYAAKKSVERKFDPQQLSKQGTEKKSSERLKFFSKEQREKPPKNAFIDFVARGAKEGEWLTRKQKQFNHFRHSSQRDLKLANHLNIQLVNTANLEKQFINQQKIRQKQFFLLKKNVNIASPQQSQSTKKLLRMKSDLIDHSTTFKNSIAEKIELEDSRVLYLDLKDKIKELQQENQQKQGIIHVLQTELKEIETAFIEMKLSIAKLIKVGSSSTKNIGEIEINEALTEIIKDLQLQKEEIKRMTIDCESWRKSNFEQSLQIKNYEEQLSQYKRINETINQLKEQNNRYRDQMMNVTSKLQVSNNENRIKDEFIVKFLIGRSMSSTTEDDKVDSIAHLLENYLKTCSYPNNKLMEKLNEEQNEIKKLKSLVEKDRKNSI